MGKKERERAERGEFFRGGKTVKMVPCPFSGCTNYVMPGAKEIMACERHIQLIRDVLFILDHTRLRGEVQSPAERRAAGKAPARIILPGSPEFNKAVKEDTNVRT